MLNTYSILSTGINGVEYIPYHYGSTVLYVGLANFLDISLLEAYVLLPAIAIAPLFVYAFLVLIIEIRNLLHIENKFGIPFVSILLIAFVGFYKNTLYQSSGNLPEYSGMLLGSPILFVSDSYTVSLIFMFIFFSLCVNYYQNIRSKSINKVSNAILLIVVFPSLFICCGFSKISTLYALFVVIAFLLVRLKLYKAVFLVSFLMILTSFIILFNFSRDSRYGDGVLSWFHNFTVNKQNIVFFFLLKFTWLWVLLIFYRFGLNRNSLTSTDSKRLLLEVVFMMALASLAPAFLVVINSGHLDYFTEIHAWFAVAFLLALLPLYDTKKLLLIDKPPYLRRILATIICFYFVWIWNSNSRIYRNEMLRTNYLTRYNVLLGPPGLLTPDKFNGPSKLLKLTEAMRSAIWSPLNSPYLDSLRVEPARSFIKKLSDLDELPLEVKSKALIYIDFEKLQFELPLKCFEKPLLIPALSGIASINGGLSKKCISENPWFSGYGFEHYDAIENHVVSLKTVRAQVVEKGFSWLFIYDNTLGEFIKVSCR
jgi:hypothetical protein